MPMSDLQGRTDAVHLLPVYGVNYYCIASIGAQGSRFAPARGGVGNGRFCGFREVDGLSRNIVFLPVPAFVIHAGNQQL
jgi:hypothetical protein